MRLRLPGTALSIVIATTLLAQTPEAGLPEPDLPPAPARELRVISNATFGITQTNPDISAVLGTSDGTSAFTVYSADNATRFFVRGDGATGIGTRTPADTLELVKDSTTAAGIRINNPNTGGGTTAATTLLRFFEGGVYKAYLMSANSAAASVTGGANSLHLWNRLNAPLLLATNNIERIRIHGEGNVSIGSTKDMAKLFVWNVQGGGTAIQSGMAAAIDSDVTQHNTAATFLAVDQIQAGFTNSGSVTGQRLRASVALGGTVAQTVGQLIEAGVTPGNAGNVTTAYGSKIHLTAPAGSSLANGYGVYIADVEAATKAWGIYQAGTNDTNYLGGQLRLGAETVTAGTETAKLHITGNAHVTGTLSGGNIQAVYQDVAEWVPATADLAPGTVVVLNTARNNEVMASAGAYDTRVAGVVSAQPGLSLGVAGAGKEQIATTGRVRVHVDARTTPIAVGDLLVTGDLPGTAMRSEPIEIAGRKFHQPGTIIGKALEPLDRGTGEILVLLSMQ